MHKRPLCGAHDREMYDYGLEKNHLDGKPAAEGGSGTTLTVAHIGDHAPHDTDRQTVAATTAAPPRLAELVRVVTTTLD
jgi:hypothetical protein